MDSDDMGEIIATRMLNVTDGRGAKRSVSVLIGKPQLCQDASGYQCPFQVIGIGSQKTYLARGKDSIQALQSAMVLIAANLTRLNNELSGGLSWDGDGKGELGFP